MAGTGGSARPTTVDLAGIRLRTPVLNASGTFDAVNARRVFGDELVAEFPFSAYVTKTITVAPRDGNPPARLWESASGLVNSVGLPNPGLRAFVREVLPRMDFLPVPLIVSVAGFTGRDWAELVAEIGRQPGIAGIELNASCPNVESGCSYAARPDEMRDLMRIVRPLTDKPLVAKLTPNTRDIAAVAEAAEEGGADALALINTVRAAPVNPRTMRPALGGGGGGLSGPAIKPIALGAVYAVAKRSALPLVGMGGISSGRDAADFMAAGARCVAVGTENFRDPAAGRRIAGELDEIARFPRKGVPSSELDAINRQVEP